MAIIWGRVRHPYRPPLNWPARPARRDGDSLLLTLSDALGVPYGELATLQSQGYTSGVIARVYVIAQAAGVPVDQVLARYNNGESWVRIRSDYGLYAGQQGELTPIVLGNGRGYSIRQDSGGGWFGGEDG